MSWLNWLFPTHARCMGCHQVRLPCNGPPFCIQCRKGLEKVVVPKPRCGWCGYPMQGNECRFCKTGGSRYIHWICAPFLYKGPVRKALPRLKYQGWGQGLDYLGEKMWEAWQQSNQPEPDMLTHVPMLPRREKVRGRNQARLLAEAAASHLGCEAQMVLKRVKQGKSQVGLTAAQRRKNLKGCFQVTANVRGKYILLVDDVVTTGATVSECARMLMAAGAAQVWVLAAALNLRKK